MSVQNINVKIDINWPQVFNVALVGTHPAKKAFFFIKSTAGDPMTAAAFTVDSVGRTGTVGFLDDKGDTTSPPSSSGAAIGGVTSDNPAALTAAADPNNPWNVDFTVVAEGTANVQVSLVNCLDDAGNEIADPAPVAITVGPGDAASAELTVN